MNAALAFDAPNPFERRAHHADMEMGFADAAIFPRRAGMAGMLRAFIGNFERAWREGGGEFFADGVGNAHLPNVRGARPKVKKFLSLFLGRAIP